MSDRRVYIGPSPIDGAPIFRISPPTVDALTCPEKDLYFGEKYYSRKPYASGYAVIPPRGNGGPNTPGWEDIIVPTGTPGISQQLNAVRWLQTINFGKTFSKPPDVEFSYYDEVDQRVKLPWVFIGSVDLLVGIRVYSCNNFYYVVRKSSMVIGLIIYYSPDLPNQSNYAYWTTYQTNTAHWGRIGYLIWDEL